MRSVVNKAFGQIVETGRVRLFKSHRPEFADGEQRRDFLYVKDAVAMTLDLVAEPGANGLFNIGSGKSHTWRELVTGVLRSRSPDRHRVHRDAGRVAREDQRTRPRPRSNVSTKQDTAGRSRRSPMLSRDYVTHYLVPGKHLGDEPAR